MAPQSPSMTRSPRSAGSTASGGAERAGDRPPAGPPSVGGGGQRAGLAGAAGTQVEQVQQVRGAGDQAGGEDAVGQRRRPACPRRVSTAAAAAAAPMPATLTAPAETRPARSAREVPGQALVAGLLGAGAGEVVVAADQRRRRRRPARPRRGVPAGAPSGGGRGGGRGERRAAEQGDRPAGVVRPPPGRAGRPGGQRGGAGQGGPRGRGARRAASSGAAPVRGRPLTGSAAGTGGTGWVSSPVPYLPEVPSPSLRRAPARC